MRFARAIVVLHSAAFLLSPIPPANPTEVKRIGQEQWTGQKANVNPSRIFSTIGQADLA
jgi:hypothetical protein